MSHDWTVSHSKDGATLHIYDYSMKTRLLVALEEVVETFDAEVAGHWLCANGLPEVFWKIPLGKAKVDPNDPEFLENSLAGKVFDLYGRFSNLVYQAQKKDEVSSMPLSQEELLTLAPDWGWLFEDEEEPVTP